ncbi:hypothetical protein CS053_08275 [Rhodanobacter glycinis]|uniref:Uncharacterized protein n=1 Tax=Rhodanobacter glycinis TaxID=582702 RepID=A0A5B9E2L1_9GAMM|nr:hypothetical protein [Rhodanobacter glycinis]QEE24496.1 hypothetical protein CS053_08275 [Rhodanobacter glycinis]
MATLSLATHVDEPFRVSASGKCVHLFAGLTRITITRDEAAHLAADILDAIGAASFESVEVLPPPLEAAIKRNEVKA